MYTRSIVFALCAVLGMLMLGAQSAQQELATTIARDGYRLWEPLLDIAKETASQHFLKTHAQVERVKYEDARVVPATMYTLGFEFDIGTSKKGSRYEYSFLHPSTEWRHVWDTDFTLAAEEATPPPASTALSLLHDAQQHIYKPELSITLRGPLEVYITDPTTELRIRAPREVDVGAGILRIMLEEGVNATLSGFTEMHLLDPLTVTAVSVVGGHREEGGHLRVHVRNVPRVGLVGARVHIANASVNEVLKVRRSGNAEITLGLSHHTTTHTTTHAYTTQTTHAHTPATTYFEVPLDDARVRTVEGMVGGLRSQGEDVALRKLYYAKIEAVTGVYIPVVTREEGEHSTEWDVVVAHRELIHAHTRAYSGGGGGVGVGGGRVVSAHKKPTQTEVTFAPNLAANGTLHEALEAFIAHNPEYGLTQRNL